MATLAGYSGEQIAPEDVHTRWMHRFLGAVIQLVNALNNRSHSFLTTTLNHLRQFTTLFKPFISLHEAEAIAAKIPDTDTFLNVPVHRPPLWHTIVLSFLSALQFLSWLGISLYSFFSNPDLGDCFALLPSLLMCIYWLGATFWPFILPSSTPPYGLFAVYMLNVLFHALYINSMVYSYYTIDIESADIVMLFLMGFNFVCNLALSAIVLHMPLAHPSGAISKDDIGRSISPEDYTTLFNWLTFRWILPLIQAGTSRTLYEADVWKLTPTLRSRVLFVKLKDVPSGTLISRIWRANSLDAILECSISILCYLLELAEPLFLNLILTSISEEAEHPESSEQYQYRLHAFSYAFLTFFISLFRFEADVQRLWIARRLATRIRSELIALIYEKSLIHKDTFYSANKDSSTNTSSEDKGSSTVKNAAAGKSRIVNLMSVDVNDIQEMSIVAMYVSAGPIQVIACIVFLYRLIGWSAFVGVAFMIFSMSLSNWTTRRSISINRSLSKVRDQRMGLIVELISNIKHIKFFGWEPRFLNYILALRETELSWIRKRFMNNVIFGFSGKMSPIIICIAAFSTYVFQGNQLTVSTAFTAIAVFKIINLQLSTLPGCIMQMIQGYTALQRISDYLDEPEVDAQTSSLKANSGRDTASATQATGLGIENGVFTWNTHGSSGISPNKPMMQSSDDNLTAPESTEERSFKLQDIDITFPEGRLTCVMGPTASGKTALLLALLGEMSQMRGKLIMSKDPSVIDSYGNTHTISYASQAPWLQHQSIRDNILFGSHLDEERYNQVLECCALKPDLVQLIRGDETAVGARGVSLSGGQKARVALARAVYARSKYVLLDDPLSAVDSHTSRFLFDRLLCGPLLANRTVILVTHHVELVLPGTHYLVRMFHGRVDLQGTVEDLRSRGLLDGITRDLTQQTQKVAADAVAETESQKMIEPPVNTNPAKDSTEEESRFEGAVKWSIYRNYLSATSYWMWVIITFLILLGQALGVGQKLWIKVWGDAYKSNQALATTPTGTGSALQILRNLPPAAAHPLLYVGIFSLISVSQAFIGSITELITYIGSTRASRRIFRSLLTSIVSATFRWYDVTPIGRIVHRFSNDIKIVDSTLSETVLGLNGSLASFAVSVITITAFFPQFLVPAAFLAFIYQRLANGYLNTGRDLRRMESNARSPIFSSFTDLLDGLVTIRAFSAEHRFLDELHEHVDLMSQMWYTFWNTNRWLLLNFAYLGAIAVLITTLFALSGYVSAGVAAICITSATTFTSGVYWGCRNWTSLELELNALERITEYIEIPKEAPLIIDSNRPPAYWPSFSSSHDMLVVENLSARYAENLPAVLHNVSFSLKGGERVGLLGRTGSGKSTLVMSLLRFAEALSGRIMIDGIDISSIGLHDLRSRITFIPQDATLFSGTLRDNLDPFCEHNDAECLEVLRRVYLVSEDSHAAEESSQGSMTTYAEATSSDVTYNNVQLTLDTTVSTGGMNFSHGQKQLISIARALLRSSPIVIMDEATSSVDLKTDEKIQATLRNEFKGSLMLTVAHRIRSVIDYNRLIVLDEGRIVEFDTPYNLIQKENGVFRNMCLQSGHFDDLHAIAATAAKSS